MLQNFLSPQLSCVDQPTDQIAEKSMEILLANINATDEFEPRNIQIDTDLILRGTCNTFNKK